MTAPEDCTSRENEKAMKENETLKAFIVSIEGCSCIAFAQTAAKARWQVVRSYWDAGYGLNRWPRPTSRRCPKYDGCRINKPGAYTEDHVRVMMP